MKNILLLTDFSDNALNAMHYAMQFFKSEHCTFYVMHVFKVKSFISDDLMYSNDTIYESIVNEPKEKLDHLVARLKKAYHNSNHSFETIIDFDVFTDAINQIVTIKNIDYIVMGSNGVTGAKEILFGSNTVNVIRKVNCKTLVIPEDYSYKTVKELLLPITQKNNLKTNDVDTLLELINSYKFHIHVLGFDSKNGNFNILKSKIDDCDYSTVTNVPIDYAISSYLQIHDIDMILFLQDNRTFLERLFEISPTESISQNLTIPILIIHTETS